MYEAARVDDPIYHTSALAGFLIGAIIGIAIIALAAFAFFSCGFLAGLILGFMADQIASGVLQLGEAIGRSIHHTAGKILTGSENVSTNSRPAARAVLSTVKCDNHIAEKRIAQGSENIYINSQPAARKDDHTECDAVIEDGSPNVFLGGGTQTVLEISSEIPDWLRKVVDVLFVVASLLGGLAGAWRQAAKLGTKFGTKCAAKFIGGELTGMAVSEAISGLFSNPVDVTTGQKILLPETDFTLPGRLPVTCSRFYASHLETVGLLGRGWRLNWETSLREDDEHITLTGVQGRELRYPKTMLTPGHQIFDPKEQLYLSRLHDGRYVLHYTDRSYYVFGDFDSDGMAYLLFMETPHRQRIVFGHEGGRLVRIASSSGHHLLLHRTQTPAGERLSRIELVQGGTRGNLVEYRYDDNGQLTGVVNRAGTQVRQFAYENGLMTAHSNAAGFTCRYRWQELDGAPRVTEHDTSDGEHYRFDYDFAAGTTTVTGRQGESWQWWYDRETYITAHRTPGGGMYRFTYNEDHFPVNIELPGGRTVAYEYDIQNRVVKTTDPEGRVTQTQWNGEFDEITRTALDDDAVWKTQYNAHGQPVQETDPEGRVTQYAYDEQGQMCSRTDAAGGTVVTAFDSRGQMTRYTDCSGRSTGYDHDEDGNLTRVTDAEGKVVRISYNRLGLPETVNSPGKQQDRYTWNAQGQLTRVISGNTETHYGYDALGRRIRKATYGRHTGHTARSRTDFVWEGFRLLQENVQQQGWRTYLYDAEQPYTPVASVTGKGESRQVWYYHTDVTGTPQEVTAADGTLVWAGYIRGFGENAADISNSGAYFHQPLRLPGQYFDDETGLHYNLFRYYAPECGRFVSQDPIGLKGGLNLYAYAPNPIRWIDPLGLAILEHQSNFDAARRTGFENAGMTNPEDVTFSKVDPKTGTVVEFKGPNGAKVAYDAPHADMDVTAGHDKPHVGWQSAGKRGSGGANRGNITYDGPQHPHRSDSKGDDKC
ncbi:PAAR domain-containing protein [Salmonella enterica subsp. enterica serovar Newport]|nr:PAAR domain-containing protein [Salmonella enterica subsp. enterica serovar Newport]